MKRIQSACLEQTILFTANDALNPGQAAQAARQEVEHYKASPTRRQTAYRIEEELPRPDGSILVKLKRQYNAYPCGDYLK